MSIQLEQKFLNVESTDGTANSDDATTLHYQVITDAGETEDDVRDHCRANLPTGYFGLVRENFSLARASDSLWEVDVEFGPADSAKALPKLEVDQTRYSIRGGSGGSAKRTFSLGLISEHVAPGVGGLRLADGPAERIIGLTVDKNGYEAKGVDEPVGQISIDIETVKNAENISGGYLVSLAEYAKRQLVNSATFRGFAAGTLKIVDFDAAVRGGDDPDWDISIQIEYEPNLTNIVVGNGITVTSKKGHELLDVLYDVQIRNTAPAGPPVKLPLAVPIRAAVHQMKDTLNFNTALGI